MVKTRSSARIGSGAATSAVAGSADKYASSSDRPPPSAHRNPRNNTSLRQNQVVAAAAAAAASAGGGGTQGKDPLAPALPAARALYPHPATAQPYPHTQDSRVVLPVPPRTNSLYASSVYHQYQSQQQAVQTGQLAAVGNPSPSAGIPPYPVHPDVRFKRLPFYDILAEILKPSSLVPTSSQRMQEAAFYFHLTPQQASDIATGKDIVGVGNKLENIVQAQLRFCLLETSCEQEDFFPASVSVKINNKPCPLPNPIPTNKPGVEPKRPPRPVNITSLVKLSPTVANTITVAWAADFARGYVLSVTLVRKLTSSELLQRLKNKGTKNPDYTRSLIKEKLSEDYDSEIATTSLRVSLVCPLGKMRMQVPCRSSGCPHLQCFDASLFLQMNERKPTWVCPVCDRPAAYDTLVVDGYFQDVLNSSRLNGGCNEVQLHQDGSWSAHVPPPRVPAPISPSLQALSQQHVQLISDDLEVIPLEPPAKRAALGSGSAPTPADVVTLVDLTSDSDDDLPLKRKVAKCADSSSHAENTHFKFNCGEGGAAVSSSGYQSPAAPERSPPPVISLDSPSPPAPSPAPADPHLTITPLQTTTTDGTSERGSPLPAHQASVTRWSGAAPPTSPTPDAPPADTAPDNYRRY